MYLIIHITSDKHKPYGWSTLTFLISSLCHKLFAYFTPLRSIYYPGHSVSVIYVCSSL